MNMHQGMYSAHSKVYATAKTFCTQSRVYEACISDLRDSDWEEGDETIG